MPSNMRLGESIPMVDVGCCAIRLGLKKRILVFFLKKFNNIAMLRFKAITGPVYLINDYLMDTNISTKLTQLLEVQECDKRLDDIIKLRGTLPEEVDASVQNIEKLYAKIAEDELLLISIQEEIAQKKAFVKGSEKKIQQYESQQMEVRNNREYEAITKELELHKLDIQLAEKFLRTAYVKIEQVTADLAELNKILKAKEADCLLKKDELSSILQINETEERALCAQRASLVAKLDELLYITYERIRQSVRNNVAVVSIKKGACGGCCIAIPPQQKLEIHERSKILYCEHCGRILIAPEKSYSPMVMETLKVSVLCCVMATSFVGY